MLIPDLSVSPLLVVLAPLLALLACYLVPYVWTHRHLRGIPGPCAARLSSWWLLLACRAGKRYHFVDLAHKRHGPVVRIQPNHVSIADEEAVQLLYGHGNGLVKSSWYDGTVIGNIRSTFNARDRREHSRKRKVISHSFSPQSVRNFEPFVRSGLQMFIKKWDEISDAQAQGDGYADVEGRSWLNYLTLDIISDLTLGAPLGVLQKGSEHVEVYRAEDDDQLPIYIPVTSSLTSRSEVSSTIGSMLQLKPYLKWVPDPFFHAGLRGMIHLRDLAMARILGRLKRRDNGGLDRRGDLLDSLLEGRDEKGEAFSAGELTVEALTLMIAGTETMTSTLSALLYHISRNSGVLEELRRELDGVTPAGVDIPSFDQLKSLPYLGAVINEALRHHSSVTLGLPRDVPQGGLTIQGRFYPAGTVLSVPIYTLHRMQSVWGPDADEFRPERWFKLTAQQKKAFIPFSHGPRACLGRNLAELELKLITATWVRRYDVVLRKDEMVVRDGLARKPIAVRVGVKQRRDVSI